MLISAKSPFPPASFLENNPSIVEPEQKVIANKALKWQDAKNW